ncbi:hypothetical protein CHLRE_08g385950v5 [Chlamydomonas reinhardtii]|uniref:Uncharacterized protein n=1 Tax=Chlamydomonas reinhardtii TaxID=3055 RepID=A0A2K3DIE0_CHLRE|nr:uncharacterized protein CHLRE_08g385950v5 [Chlamydomonas reinhardtii]PNW80298.1 hypothetical protein CHLRE_08g385950v5 [Chlamydomonas reinhardtii]
MGNSMLKSHCRKEGLAWTLRDVAAYGLALGKMAPGAPLDWTAAVRFLAQLQPEGGGGGGGAPSPALVERVSGLMRGAAAKYDMEAFIARQQTRSKPRQQPAHGGGNEGGAGGAPAAVAGAAVAGAAVAGAPASPRPHGRNQVLAGPAAAATAAATAAAAPSPAAGGTPRRRGSGGVAPGAAASGRGNGPSAAVPVGLTSAAQSAPAPAPSAPPAVPQGPLRVGAGLEARLRAHLARQGLTQLRLRNAREGLAWSLLELVAADRDVRLSQPHLHCLREGQVAARLAAAKLPPGQQLPPAALAAVCARRTPSTSWAVNPGPGEALPCPGPRPGDGEKAADTF